MKDDLSRFSVALLALIRRAGVILHPSSLILLVACAGTAIDQAQAQTYPTKPIRLVTAEAGGGNDYAARVIVQGLAGSLGQSMVVDNRGGAGGAIAVEIVARARPDGYTLLLYANNIWLIPLLRSNVPYDAVKDFAPITWAAKSPNTVVVHASLPVKSIEDLVAYAKARPGELNYGSGGTGSTSHLAVELFKAMAAVDIVRISFKGNGPAMNALLGGQVQLMFATAGSVAPYLKSGKVRALAVTSPEPTALAPGLPTVASAGLPGYEQVSIYGVYGPAGTPAAVIKRLNEEIVRVLGRADVRERFLAAGVETVGSTPELLAATMKAEIKRMAKVIKDAGIREE